MDHLAGKVKQKGSFYFLNSLMFSQQGLPGNLQCQKTHPSTGLRVMEIAAAEGDKNSFPFKNKAPPFTLA